MDFKSAVKVGFMVVVGAVALFFGWRFLSHSDPNRYALYADFDDVKGLMRQTPLRMNGVTIGEVANVGFAPGTLRPRVKLWIENRFRDKIPDDSSIRITSGLLIQNAQIEIVPGISTVAFSDGATFRNVEKMPAGALAQLSPEANEALKEMTATIQTLSPKLTALLDGMQGILKRTNSAMSNVEVMTQSAKGLITDPKLRDTMRRTLATMDFIAADLRDTSKSVSTELKGLVKRSGGKFDQLTTGAFDLLTKFADTVDAARGALTKLTEQVSDPRLQQSLLETVDLAKATLARFNQIATDIHNLTGDPIVQDDLKSTLATLKDTTEEGQKLVKKVGELVGSIKKPTGPQFGIGKPEFTIDFLGRSNRPNFRSDLGMRLPIGGRNALNLGFYDFAERMKLNAQYETDISGFGALRYGLHAGKLGAGFDWGTRPGTKFQVDAYDPNNFKLDARGVFNINKDFSFTLGVDSLFKHSTPTLGIQLKR